MRVNTTLVGLKEDDIKIGMRVKPVRARVSEDGTVLLRFTGAHVDLVEIDEVVKQPEAPVAADVKSVRQVPLTDDAALQSLVSEEFSPW
ncbi:acyl dehydratase, partial [Pseudomonas sp. MPR-R2A3]